MRIIRNIRLGKPDVSPTAPSHQWGIQEGNEGRQRAVRNRRTRSTGISPKIHTPIDPRMPQLTPA